MKVSIAHTCFSLLLFFYVSPTSGFYDRSQNYMKHRKYDSDSVMVPYRKVPIYNRLNARSNICMFCPAKGTSNQLMMDRLREIMLLQNYYRLAVQDRSNEILDLNKDIEDADVSWYNTLHSSKSAHKDKKDKGKESHSKHDYDKHNKHSKNDDDDDKDDDDTDKKKKLHDKHDKHSDDNDGGNGDKKKKYLLKINHNKHDKHSDDNDDGDGDGDKKKDHDKPDKDSDGDDDDKGILNIDAALNDNKRKKKGRRKNRKEEKPENEEKGDEKLNPNPNPNNLLDASVSLLNPNSNNPLDASVALSNPNISPDASGDVPEQTNPTNIEVNLPNSGSDPANPNIALTGESQLQSNPNLNAAADASGSLPSLGATNFLPGTGNFRSNSWNNARGGINGFGAPRQRNWRFGSPPNQGQFFQNA